MDPSIGLGDHAAAGPRGRVLLQELEGRNFDNKDEGFSRIDRGAFDWQVL